MDLIRQCEAQFLFPAAAPGSSDVLRLFRPISLHLAPPGPSGLLKADTKKGDIAPTSSTQAMPASQNVSEPEREDVFCSNRPAAGTGCMAAAASEPTIQPDSDPGAMQPATPAEVLTGISCLFGAGGEVRILMV